MGRDYDAAVMSGGFIGFMLGTTANAMAVHAHRTRIVRLYRRRRIGAARHLGEPR
jgi:Na+/glutamate symporter